FDSTSAWFAEAGSGVSAHYLVGLDGRVVQFVDEHDAARHVRSNRPSSRLFRRGDANCSSVGIEFEDAGAPDAAPRTAEQYAAGAASSATRCGRTRPARITRRGTTAPIATGCSLRPGNPAPIG